MSASRGIRSRWIIAKSRCGDQTNRSATMHGQYMLFNCGPMQGHTHAGRRTIAT